VEAIFRTAKSILETRPIYHQCDATIAGHLFCSFLALLLRKELDEQLAAAGVEAEWDDIIRDLDRVEQITVEQGTKRFVLRPHAPGCAGSVFKAVGVALPPLVHHRCGTYSYVLDWFAQMAEAKRLIPLPISCPPPRGPAQSGQSRRGGRFRRSLHGNPLAGLAQGPRHQSRRLATNGQC
jgi:hypothetical protein